VTCHVSNLGRSDVPSARPQPEVANVSRRSLAIALSFAVLAVGCDQATATPRPSVDLQPVASLTSVEPAAASATPPPPPAPALAWARPLKGEKLREYEVDLAVDATAPDLRRVEFAVSWKGGSAAACTAARPDGAGLWTCHADLFRARVLPGAVKFTVKGFDTAERAIPELKRSIQATFAVVPPRPGSVKFEEISTRDDPDEPGLMIRTDRIRWTAPKGYATEFRLYGVTSCPNEAPDHDGQPCLVEHMSLAKDELRLIETADGDERSMTIANGIPDGLCGPTLFCSDYNALVLGAFNAYGHSVYAIVVSNEICHTCVY
jgi:hypothetical protein